MGRPRKDTSMAAVSIRLTPTLMAEIDRATRDLEAQTPLGLEVTRTEVIRYLLLLGVEAHKAKHTGAGKRRSKS
jgi:hypothetical protein